MNTDLRVGISNISKQTMSKSVAAVGSSAWFGIDCPLTWFPKRSSETDYVQLLVRILIK